MFEEQTDQYLIHSDVFSSKEDKSNNDTLVKSSLQFLILSNNTNENIKFDDDGDLDINRPERLDIILGIHFLWNGALLLCDFLLTNSSRFLNRIIFELGAGIGLCTIVASRFASRIISTDYDSDLLEIIRENMELNDDICQKEKIEIKKFDWKQCDCDKVDDRIEIIIAADVVYDDDLTDALFDVFIKLFQTKSNLQSIYITIEKRINFYTETLSIQCPAYEYFLEKLTELKNKYSLLIFEELNTDLQSIQQCTTIYNRTKELVGFSFVEYLF
ncbi:hypothetical protein I4U23_009125 [Adineta vaga]|nr:hypothetical protein I4U23_009125 [Adineta vaga]